jgi:hypothetical protein
MHRACPGRLARKIGCTLALKNSKSSDADAMEEGAGCWLSNPANITAQQTAVIGTRPPFPIADRGVRIADLPRDARLRIDHEQP